MNGFECLDFFRSNPTRLPDAVLLDVMMPGMDGFEVCSKLRSPEGQFALGPSELPIIMLSAREPVPSSIIQGLLSGSNDCASVRPSVRPFVRSLPLCICSLFTALLFLWDLIRSVYVTYRLFLLMLELTPRPSRAPLAPPALQTCPSRSRSRCCRRA